MAWEDGGQHPRPPSTVASAGKTSYGQTSPRGRACLPLKITVEEGREKEISMSSLLFFHAVIWNFVNTLHIVS